MQSNDDNNPPSERSQTPPINHPEPAKTTPRKGGPGAFTTNATEHRLDIAKEMNPEMNLCNTFDNFTRYLPAEDVLDETIDLAVQSLQRKGSLVPRTVNELRFKGFQCSPSQSIKPTEEARFKPLIEIIKHLGEFVSEQGRVPSGFLVQEPNKFCQVETAGGNFKIDAYLRLTQSTVPAERKLERPLADVVIPCEFKTSRADRFQNRRQLLGHASFCMTDDPRRMHMYGITIEDSIMAIWHFTRGYSVKSPDFDFLAEYRLFIKIMLIFLFADQQKLGYDQSVRRCIDVQGDLCFVYQVNGKYYKTVRSIFEPRSLCITGRGTRVWQVVEVKSFDDLTPPLEGGPDMVLKDVWLDKGAMTEGQNYQAISDELEKIAKAVEDGEEPGFFFEFGPGQDRLKECLENRDWGRYFLTKECDWQGYESKELGDGATPNSRLFAVQPSDPQPPTSSLTSRSRNSSGRPTDPAGLRPRQRPRSYRSKQQYRVVYKEICKPLHDVRRFDDLTTALEDCVFALKLMFLTGWVHRDISSGNVYLFKDNQEAGQVRGILGDLEYAKRFSDTKFSLDPKTGTAYFMAVEIQTQQLMGSAIPAKERGTNPSNKDLDDEVKQMNNQAVVEIRGGVRHHFQHDIESVFWLLLWNLLRRFPSEQKGLDDAILTVFQDSSTCPPDRAEIINHEGALSEYLNEWLHKDLADLISPLVVLRRRLRAAYDGRPQKLEDRADYARLYRYTDWLLGKCRDVAMNPNLPPLVPWSSSLSPTIANTPSSADQPNQETSKRKRSPEERLDDDEHPQRARPKVEHPTPSPFVPQQSLAVLQNSSEGTDNLGDVEHDEENANGEHDADIDGAGQEDQNATRSGEIGFSDNDDATDLLGSEESDPSDDDEYIYVEEQDSE
ncbi:hypothetical protein FRB90_009170 [Tulasnella sp. 427]|nr:hypothetical protein FRB90_009170 [Tulasnella sp. 427]